MNRKRSGKFILSLFFILSFIQLSAQNSANKDTIITLHPDTTDSYVLSYYISGRYRIEIGYSTYLKKVKYLSTLLDGYDGAAIIKSYIDSLRKREKIVSLWTQHEVSFSSSSGVIFYLDRYVNEVISDLFIEGNIKVYDFRKNHYIQRVSISRKDTNDEVYDEYSDPITRKVFFTNVISGPIY